MGLGATFNIPPNKWVASSVDASTGERAILSDEVPPDNYAILRGRVTGLQAFPCDEAITYVIHFAVKERQRHFAGKENPGFGQEMNFEIMAEGVAGDDPWADLSVDDYCTILATNRWQGGEAEREWRDVRVGRKKVRDLVWAGGGKPIIWGLDVEIAEQPHGKPGS